MPENVERFLQAIPAAAATPSAFAAYALVVFSTLIVSLKTKRHAQLLKSLKDLPEHQRLQALKDEMGKVEVPRGLTPEQWLRSRIHYFLFVGFGAACAAILIVSVVAITSKPGEGKLEVDTSLYQPPEGSSATP
jgi:hypothetical protein